MCALKEQHDVLKRKRSRCSPFTPERKDLQWPESSPLESSPGPLFGSALWQPQGACLLPDCSWLLPEAGLQETPGQQEREGTSRQGRAGKAKPQAANFPHLSGKEQSWASRARHLFWPGECFRRSKKAQGCGMGLRKLLVQNSQFPDEKIRPEEWLICPEEWVSGRL